MAEIIGSCKNETVVTGSTSDYVKFENIDIKEGSHETERCSVVEDERKHTQIKTDVDKIDVLNTFEGIKSDQVEIKREPFEDISSCSLVKNETEQYIQFKKEIKDEWSLDSDSTNSQVKIEAVEMSNISTFEDIKSEEIDIKHNPLISVLSSEVDEKWTDGHYKPEADIKQNNSTRRDSSEIQSYTCAICGFTTKHKHSLKRHILMHSNALKKTDKKETYSCYMCRYKTKYKDCLKRHMLVHKDPSELTLYKCTTCNFFTKFKGSFNSHMLLHEGTSEDQLHQCVNCDFRTRHKHNLRKHNLIRHNEKPAPETYTCDICSYKTTVKVYLKSHMLVHKDPSEHTFKCTICNYSSMFKRSLNRHILTHTSKEEPLKI